MSKNDFLSSLSPNQKEYCEFLLDIAYSNGYNQALIDEYCNK